MAQATIATTVTGIQGHAVAATAPAAGQALVFNGTQWAPDSTTYLKTAGGTLTGSLAITGTGSALTVAAITGPTTLTGALTVTGNIQAANVTATGNLTGATGTFSGSLTVSGTLTASLIQAPSSPAYISTFNDLHIGTTSGTATLWVDTMRPAFASYVNCLSDFHSAGALWCGGLNWSNSSGFMTCAASISCFSIVLDNQGAGSSYYWGINAGYMYCPSSVMANAFVQSSSDPQVKTNVADYTPGVSAISQLQPITFQYNGLAETPNDAAADPSVTRIGLDASQVQAAIPAAVGTRQGLLHPSDTTEVPIMTLDTNPVLMTLINAVKQLISRVSVLETHDGVTPTAAQTA
jgi:hypothetical protein